LKIKIDKNKCYGCASCAAILPEIFEINSDGLSKVTATYSGVDITDPNVLEKINMVIESCPTGAIVLE
jgi:ferredoxin